MKSLNSVLRIQAQYMLGLGKVLYMFSISVLKWYCLLVKIHPEIQSEDITIHQQ